MTPPGSSGLCRLRWGEACVSRWALVFTAGPFEHAGDPARGLRVGYVGPLRYGKTDAMPVTEQLGSVLVPSHWFNLHGEPGRTGAV